MEGRESSSWRDYLVVQNFMYQGGPVDGVTPKVNGRMIRSSRYKYCIYNQGRRRESLVDMENDPGETINIIDDPASRYNDKMALEMLEVFETEPR